MVSWPTLQELQWIESGATIIAIAVGGTWSYLLFVRKRIGRARLNVDQSITPLRFPDGRHLVQVSVRIDNVGQVRVTLDEWKLWVQQVLPLHEKVLDELGQERPAHPSVNWPLVVDWEFDREQLRMAIEPGESDSLVGDVVVPAHVEVVKVYSHLRHKRRFRRRRDDMGWTKETLVDLRQSNTGGTRERLEA